MTTRTFFGEPAALGYLAFTEAWERFSYYGMSALMVLYMTEQLLLPGHVEHVAGFAAFRHGIEALTGPQSPRALASLIYGFYAAMIHFSPFFGGLLADRLIGARRTVLIGASLLCLGHLAMAFDASFLAALTLLILGCGCVKGNISAQVGALYDVDDQAGRTRAFVMFNIGINVGATGGPLLCGWLAQVYGWHVGFAAAGVLMLAGLITCLAGQSHFAPDHAHRQAGAGAPWQAPLDRSLMSLLVLVIAVTIFQSIAYYQTGSVGQIWIRDAVDLATPFGPFPIAWFHSVDSLFSVIGVPPLLLLWRWQAKRAGEPNDLAKIAIGAGLAALSSGLLVLACVLPHTGKVSFIWPFLCRAGMGLAFIYYWPTLLALVTRKAPDRVSSTLLGVVFLSLFVSNLLMGWIGSFYDRMGASLFWSLNTAIAACGVVFALLLGAILHGNCAWEGASASQPGRRLADQAGPRRAAKASTTLSPE